MNYVIKRYVNGIINSLVFDNLLEIIDKLKIILTDFSEYYNIDDFLNQIKDKISEQNMVVSQYCIFTVILYLSEISTFNTIPTVKYMVRDQEKLRLHGSIIPQV